MSDVGDLLELLHGASRRWRTFQGTVRQWNHTELQRRAIERWQAALGPNSSRSVMFSIGDEQPVPTEHEFLQRVWIAKPDRLREESDHGTTVSRGELWWSWNEQLGLMTNESERDVQGPKASEAHPVHLAPATLIPALHFETVERLGDTLVTVATPSNASPHGHFGLPVHGADEHRLTVDATRGVVLAIESSIDGEMFSSSHLVDAVFDESIPDQVFVLDVPDGVTPRSPHESHPQVTLEEAAELAPFPVFAIRELPEGNWRHNVHYHRPPDIEGHSVHISYHRADGRGFITLTQTATANTSWSSAVGHERVEVERDGTRLAISSETYDGAELRRLVEDVERV